MVVVENPQFNSSSNLTNTSRVLVEEVTSDPYKYFTISFEIFSLVIICISIGVLIEDYMIRK